MPFEIGRKLCGNQFGNFFRQVAPRAVIAREGRLRGVDIKTGAKPEIVGTGGITGHTFAAWAGIRRDKNQTQLGACLPKLALFRDVGVGAGEARQIPDHRELRVALMRRDVDRKGHARPGLPTVVPVNTLHAAVRSI